MGIHVANARGRVVFSPKARARHICLHPYDAIFLSGVVFCTTRYTCPANNLLFSPSISSPLAHRQSKCEILVADMSRNA